MTSTSSTGAEPRAGQVGGVGVLRPDPPTSTGSDLPDLKPFFFGGIASCVAETVTFPIDTAKTRLQLQGQSTDLCHSQRLYHGMFHCWRTVMKEEGFNVLYSGLAPALLRQAIYGTVKYGLYYTIKDVVGGEESPLKNVSIAVVAGSVSASIANPTDVLKVRLQSKSAPVVNPIPGPDKKVIRVSLYNCFRDIYVREGVGGLWRGMMPTASRAALVAGVQLPVYDMTKAFLLKNDILPGDSAWNHLLSSFCAGLCACLASSPVDVIRTRLMDQRVIIPDRKVKKVNSKYAQQTIYKSSWECGLTTIRNEGFLALYKGFVASFMRMGPWNIIFFLTYEKLKQVSSSSSSTAF